MAPIMQDLKIAKAHCIEMKSQGQAATKHFVPAADSLQAVANVCPCEARVIVSQICGAVSGLARMYVEGILKDVVSPVIEEIGAIDAAREKKEAYYEMRQRYDRALAHLQGLEEKTDTIPVGPKRDEHEEAIEEAKTKLQLATNEYDRAESAFKNFTHQALHHKACTDLTVFKAMAKCKLAEDSGILQSFEPATAELEKSRATAQANAQAIRDKCAYLLDDANLSAAAVQIEGLELQSLPIETVADNPMAAAAAALDTSASAPVPTAEEGVPEVGSTGDVPPAVPDTAPPPIPTSMAPTVQDESSSDNRVDFTITKGAKGFGFSTNDEGVITGSGGPAAAAGVPAGGRIVAVAGTAVDSKSAIIAQLQALGTGATSVVFTVQVPASAAGADAMLAI